MVNHGNNTINLLLDQGFLFGNLLCARLFGPNFKMAGGNENVNGNNTGANGKQKNNSPEVDKFDETGFCLHAYFTRYFSVAVQGIRVQCSGFKGVQYKKSDKLITFV
ncbi:MAG: hypothetical protein U9Q66_03140 [Patescibacteria group bacterium]|nr:hypothetical protein [Patescibacteria group bacterium]